MRQYLIITICCILLLAACSKDKKPSVTNAGKAPLVFPEQNSLCTAGTILSTTQSTIDFKWDAAANAAKYTLTLKNLLTGNTSTQTTTSTSLSVSLARSTPYSWYITTIPAGSGATSQSDTWKFYNSGPGEVSHVPFPADLVSPALGTTVDATNGKVTLSWQGNDVDNDISGYDVYFGTSSSPALYQSAVTVESISNISVNSGSTYYWMVVTKDSKGNSSDSAISQFTIK
jgi:hypothetical protein